jgi:hypothetical protein
MLIIKFPGNRNSLYSLNATGFTRANTAAAAGRTLGRIPTNAPSGAMGGMVAMMSGNYECKISDRTLRPVGLFLLDAVSSAYENTPTVASGKLTVMTGPGSYETDIYETVTEAGGALAIAWTASIDRPLYVSNFGLLTTEVTDAAQIIGLVTKAPTADNPILGFNTML